MSSTTPTNRPTNKPLTRRKNKKSRLGCASCKKLRIKCSEGKPSCEYCIATGRVCEYLPVLPYKTHTRRKRTKKVVDNVNIAEGGSDGGESFINSVNKQMNRMSCQNSKCFDKDCSVLSLLSEDINLNTGDVGFNFDANDILNDILNDIPDFSSDVSNGDLLDFNPPTFYTTNLPSIETYYLEFFLDTGVKICSVGVQPIIDMWKSDGFQIALQSELVRYAICAFSASVLEKMPSLGTSYPIESIPKRLYFDNSLSLLREKMDDGVTNPLELVLASYLISACSIAEFDLLPVVSKTGEADLLGISEGNSALFQTYKSEIENSFANVLFLQQYFEMFCKVKYDNELIEVKLEFIDFLEYHLHRVNDQEDVRVYTEVLRKLWLASQFSMSINNTYPLIGFFYGVSDEYRKRVREGEPFALVILAFVSAFFRRTILRARPKDDSWDQCLNQIMNDIPEGYKKLVKDAELMRFGYKFNFDIDRFNNTPIY